MPDNPSILAQLLSGQYQGPNTGLADQLMGGSLLPAPGPGRYLNVGPMSMSPGQGMAEMLMPDRQTPTLDRFMAGPSAGDVLGLAGGPSMAMTMGPAAGRNLYASLLRDAGADRTAFDTIFNSLKADKLSKAELGEIASAYSTWPGAWKSKQHMLDEIQKAFVRQARFENKIAPP